MQNDEPTTTEAGVKGRKSYTLQKKLDVLSTFNNWMANVSHGKLFESPQKLCPKLGEESRKLKRP